LGDSSRLTGVSLQNGWSTDHQRVLHWINESEKAGKVWVVANDEQNPHYTGVPPDSGFESFDGIARPESGSGPYTIDDIRKYCLWGTLLAGGAGVEYYFGYTLPQNDLGCEDWRSRDKSWDYCRIALAFFKENDIPFWEMKNTDNLIGNMSNDNSKYCFSNPGKVYVIYLPNGGSTDLDLGNKKGSYHITWYDPRQGSALQTGSKSKIKGIGKISLGFPPSAPSNDWVILVRSDENQ
jgi:cytochrome oxidase assembly protein ShyY1